VKVSTHVLDTSTGRPATNVAVRLDQDGGTLCHGRTDRDGRWTADDTPAAGVATLVFATGEHFDGACFHPEVAVTFEVSPDDDRLHVPLLLSPYGYTTYRGS
jgi:hydroxyisourate hydrolase